MTLCDWTSDRLKAATYRFNFACARQFGKYVEVNEPTLQYKAYVWRERIWLVF